MILYVIRHGDPDYATDSLTPKGKLQADALAKRLAVHGIDTVYSSPLGRAMLTAKSTCDLLGLECNIEPWTSEAEAWASFAGKLPNGNHSWAFAQQNTVLRNDKTVYLGERWYEAEGLKMIDGKEGYERLIAASDAFLNRLGYKRQGSIYKIIKPNEGRIALFCHQGLGLSWISHLLQIPPHIFWAGFDLTHSGFSVFEFRNNADGFTAPRCLCLSDTSHIYKEGLPMKYNNILDY
jgi:broad specificity phosphatase PhoE